jgi:hypothetical protein
VKGSTSSCDLVVDVLNNFASSFTARAYGVISAAITVQLVTNVSTFHLVQNYVVIGWRQLLRSFCAGTLRASSKQLLIKMYHMKLGKIEVITGL